MKEYPVVSKCSIGIAEEKHFVTVSFSGPDGLVAEFGVASETWPKLVTSLVFSALSLESHGATPPTTGSFSINVHPKNVPLATVGLGQLEGETILTVAAGSVHIPFRIELEHLRATLNTLDTQRESPDQKPSQN